MSSDDVPLPRPLARTNTGLAAKSPDKIKGLHDKKTDSIKKDKLLTGQKEKSPSELDRAWDTFKDLLNPDQLSSHIVAALLTQLQKKAVKVVEDFLKNDDKKLTMDDCIRWHLLLHTVGKEDTENYEEHLWKQLIDIIVGQWPYLAFEENPYVKPKSDPKSGPPKSNQDVKRYCVDEKKHKCGTEGMPFHVAAKCGNGKAVESMLRHGATWYGTNGEGPPRYPPKEWKLAEIVRQPSPDYKQETALDVALDSGRLLVVKELISRKDLAESLVTTRVILVALEKLDSMVELPKGTNLEPNEHRGIRVKIARSLVGQVREKAKINYDVVEKIIKSGEVEIWEDLRDGVLGNELKPFLLHLAVIHKKVGFVKRFVDDPDAVSKKATAGETGGTLRYALWYNNHPGATAGGNGLQGSSPGGPDKTRAEIRDIIVTKAIHAVPEAKTLSDIFYESDVGDLCFDMSQFNSASHQVSEFMESLIRQGSTYELLTYESTLRYAEFPPLDVRAEERDVFRDNRHLQHKHTEVFKVLEWLRETKKVETIIELRVPDRLINPHDDIEMAKKVREFKVEVLDWRVLDLCIPVLHEDTKKRLRKLHLYSSGKRAVISHWFSDEGIKSLKKLETLDIRIVRETCTSERLKMLTKEINKRLEDLSKRQTETDEKLKKPPKLEVAEIRAVTWYPTPQMDDLNMVAQSLAPKLAQWTKMLNEYVEDTVKPEKGAYRPTRIAILDNGILSISPKLHNSAADRGPGDPSGRRARPNGGGGGHGAEDDREDQYDDNRSLRDRIKGGRSFVDGTSRHSSWLFASNAHGTQMANLICAIDPCCEIYVARVAEDAHGITAERVEKAIAWARRNKVDVISMSFVIGEGSKGLENQITGATNEGIVMTCSTHDEGSGVDKAYPAGYKGETTSLIVLAASDRYGRILRYVEKDKYDFLVQGQDVAAGSIPFLDSEDTVTGSSVATALAAGVSSLILTCHRLANPGAGYGKGHGVGSRYELVKEQLGSMQAAPADKFIHLDKFGKIADLARGGSGKPGAMRVLQNFKQ